MTPEDKFIKLFIEKFEFVYDYYDSENALVSKTRDAISIDDFIEIFKEAIK